MDTEPGKVAVWTIDERTAGWIRHWATNFSGEIAAKMGGERTTARFARMFEPGNRAYNDFGAAMQLARILAVAGLPADLYPEAVRIALDAIEQRPGWEFP